MTSPSQGRRPKPCGCYARRAIASSLGEMFPDVRVSTILRVLQSVNDDQQAAAEYLLSHSADIAGVDDDEAARPCTDKSHCFVAVGDRPVLALKHNNALYGSVVPPAPGVTAPVVMAVPNTAVTPLENAARCVCVHPLW